MEIKNILEKLEIPVKEQVNAEKFIATIACIDMSEALEFKNNLDYYGIKLTKCGELKYYTKNQQEQEIVFKRLQYLKDNGITLDPNIKFVINLS